MKKIIRKLKSSIVDYVVNNNISTRVENNTDESVIYVTFKNNNNNNKVINCNAYNKKEHYKEIPFELSKKEAVFKLSKNDFEPNKVYSLKFTFIMKIFGFTKIIERPIFCGKFQGLLDTSANKTKFGLLNTRGGFLNLVHNSRKPQVAKLRSFKLSKDLAYIKVDHVWSLNRDESCDFVLKSRSSSCIHRFTAKMVSEKQKSKNSYTATYSISLAKIFEIQDADIYDLFIASEKLSHEEPTLLRLKTPVIVTRAKCKTERYNQNNVVLFESFITMYGGLSFRTKIYDLDAYKCLKQAFFMKYWWRIKHKNVWLVGEKPYKAQDTGLAFYKYLLEQKKPINAYYVLDEASPEKANLPEGSKIVFFGSAEHVKLSCAANYIVGSHYAEDLIPFKDNVINRLVKAKKVFLQHGVMGVKNMVNTYGVQSILFNTDLFIVSSDYEKEYIRQDFGFHKDRIKATGLSRYDALTPHIGNCYKNYLLVMPTWRDWLNHEADFLKSDYFSQWKNLICSSELQGLCQRNGLEIIFCIHPNMQKYSSYFKHESVRVINQGEVNVQQLLIDSHTLVTDYSSVGFDFSYLNKLVIYFQFDRNKFIGKRPSHLDLDFDLPGHLCMTYQAVLDALNKSLSSKGSEIKVEALKKANKFFRHKDSNNCQRIYDEIINVKSNIYWSELTKTIYAKMILAKLYRLDSKFKFRKAVYCFFKFIPMRKRSLFVESNNGNSFSDSPAVITKEILSRDIDVNIIISLKGNNVAYVRDPRVTFVKRLSMSYYFYLATSKYWMNNQNFPAYIRKPKDTVYLQTWHGTPVKKMLHDLDFVYGRSDNYIKNISRCVSEWDFLLSPSKYATSCFSSAFKFQGQVIEEGYPRNDIFFSSESTVVRQQVRNLLEINSDTTLILYAPTFRDDELKISKEFELLDLVSVSKKLPDNSIFAVKLHPIDSGKIKGNLPENIINLSYFNDIQKLMIAADLLVTDYSSTMFDYALQDKPLIIYAPDYDKYSSDLRGLYFDLSKELSSHIVYHQDDLENRLSSPITFNEKSANVFRAKYCDKYRRPVTKTIVDSLLCKGFLK